MIPITIIIIGLCLAALGFFIIYKFYKRSSNHHLPPSQPTYLNHQQFSGILKITNVLLLLTLILISISIICITGFLIYIATLSHQQILSMIDNGTLHIDLKFEGVDYKLSKEVLANGDIDKGLLIGFFSLYLINLIIIGIITFFAKKLVGAFNRNLIFTHQNGNTLEVLAVLFAILGLTSDTAHGISSIIIDRLTQFSSQMIEKGIFDGVTYKVIEINWSFLLGALIIWLIGKAFKYGAYLQQEYDATV